MLAGLLIGFWCGVATMLVVRWAVERSERARHRRVMDTYYASVNRELSIDRLEDRP